MRRKLDPIDEANYTYRHTVPTPPESRKFVRRATPAVDETPATVRFSDAARSKTPTSERVASHVERPTSVPESSETERPTMAPNFDLAEFARKSADSKRPMDLPTPEPQGVVVIAGPTHLQLEGKYTTELGSLARVPVVRMDPTELRGMNLEPAAGFLLSNMDGISTVEMLLDLGGMPRVEALRIVCQLVRDHVVELA